jgi:hypothetical protein
MKIGSIAAIAIAALGATGCMISPTNGQLYNQNDTIPFKILVRWETSHTMYFATGDDGVQDDLVSACFVENAHALITDSSGTSWYLCSSTSGGPLPAGKMIPVGALPPDAPKPPAGANFAMRITSITKQISTDIRNDPPDQYAGRGVDPIGACATQAQNAGSSGLQIYSNCGTTNTYIFFR